MIADCFNCGRGVDEQLVICKPCLDTFRSELRKVPGLVADMTITRARLDRMSSGLAGGKSAETALPIRLDAKDRRPTQKPLDLLTNEIVTWARVVADHSRQADELNAAVAGAGLQQMVHNQRQRRRDPASLSAETALPAELAAVWLADYAEGMQTMAAIGEMHDAITDLIAWCRKLIDRMPELTYKGPCPQVSRNDEKQYVTCSADLYVERGEDYVSCPRCWTHHRVRDLDRRAIHAIEKSLLTVPEIGRLLDQLGERIPVSTLYYWVKEGHLDPVGWRQADGSISNFWMRRPDPAVYSLADVRRVAAERATLAD